MYENCSIDYFSVKTHETSIFYDLNSIISHHVICFLEIDVVGVAVELHIHSKMKEELIFLDIEVGFHVVGFQIGLISAIAY